MFQPKNKNANKTGNYSANLFQTMKFNDDANIAAMAPDLSDKKYVALIFLKKIKFINSR